jgi:hypothetical protein
MFRKGNALFLSDSTVDDSDGMGIAAYESSLHQTDQDKW